MLIYATLLRLLRKATMTDLNPRGPLQSSIFSLLDLLLPRRCAACDVAVRSRTALCAPCSASLEPVACPCPVCGLPAAGAICLSCQTDRPPFARAAAPLVFGGALSEAISRLKYGGKTHLAPALASLLVPALREDPMTAAAEVVLPVPLHPRRLRRRGFNQAALLLAPLRRHLGGRCCWGALHRIRPGPPQAALGRRQRLENLRGAFRASPAAVAGRTVLLVDDVMTTGATARACADALCGAGAAEVRVLTLARAVP